MDFPADDGLRDVLGSFAVTPEQYLGHGGEAWVYALDDHRIVRVLHGNQNPDTIGRREELVDELGTNGAPFALPDLLEVGERNGRWFTIERRLPGLSVAQVLPTLDRDQRDQLVEHHLEAAALLGTLYLAPRGWFGDLLAERPVRTTTWRGYLQERAATSLAHSTRDFAAVDADALADALPDTDTPSFLHLDAFAGNMLAQGSTITAVLDFGATCASGDARPRSARSRRVSLVSADHAREHAPRRRRRDELAPVGVARAVVRTGPALARRLLELRGRRPSTARLVPLGAAVVLTLPSRQVIGWSACTGSARSPVWPRCRCGHCATTTTSACSAPPASIPTRATAGTGRSSWRVCTGSSRCGISVFHSARSPTCSATTSRSSSCAGSCCCAGRKHASASQRKRSVSQGWKRRLQQLEEHDMDSYEVIVKALEPVRVVTASEDIAGPDEIGGALGRLYPRLYAALARGEVEFREPSYALIRGHRRRTAVAPGRGCAPGARRRHAHRRRRGHDRPGRRRPCRDDGRARHAGGALPRRVPARCTTGPSGPASRPPVSSARSTSTATGRATPGSPSCR